MEMNSSEFKALVDIVAELVECRLRSGVSTEVSQTQLRDDIIATSDRFSNLSEVVRSARRVLADHDIDKISTGIDDIREHEAPVYRDDIAEELKKLLYKIRRLQDEDTYERKLPWRHQIAIEDLVSILVEILDILRKLYFRSTQPQAQG